MFLDDVLIELLGTDVETHGRHEPAASDRVLTGMAEGGQLARPLVIGEVEPGNPLNRLEGEVARPLQSRCERTELGLRRHPVEPADPHVDGVDRSTADQLDELVADLLQIEAALHDLAVSCGQLDGAVVPEEVGSVQQIDVQRVALDPFPAVQQPAQVGERAIDGDAARRLDRIARAHLVRDRADSADAGGDVGRFGVGPAAKEGLEEPWRLVDPKLDQLQPAVADHDVHRAFALHTGECGDRERAVAVGPLSHCELPSVVRRSLSARNGSALVLKVRSMRMRSTRSTPSRSSCADSEAGFASSAGPKQP